jgi:hypothetical protein
MNRKQLIALLSLATVLMGSCASNDQPVYSPTHLGAPYPPTLYNSFDDILIDVELHGLSATNAIEQLHRKAQNHLLRFNVEPRRASVILIPNLPPEKDQISIHLFAKDILIVDAVKAVCQKAQLDYRIDENVIYIENKPVPKPKIRLEPTVPARTSSPATRWPVWRSRRN